MSRTRNRYKDEPDYTQPLLEVPSKMRQRMFARLCFLYGETAAEIYMPELERILRVHYAHKTPKMLKAEKGFEAANRFTEKDVILITYGDLLRSENRTPLATLASFLEKIPEINRVINTLHILPFFPYSSDRGFSVKDFNNVDPKLGSWQDIARLGKHYQLMFDAVFNHVSAKNQAFQGLLNGNPNFKEFFTTYHSPDELTAEQREMIVRPRTSDVLTKFDSINGPLWVWTTFSADQIDLNFRNPAVLIWVIETLLLYVRHCADIIRLDAVTYLWEEPGTPCANLDQTHEVIRLFRDILSVVAPETALITETNVPHQDNISYFGNGSDEAQMVYNFALSPLVLYTFYKEDATALSNWAKDLEYPSKTTTFFNMLDTHDGVSLQGVKNILPKEDIAFIIQNAREHGAFVSYKTGEGGQDEPYEINTTWFSALNLDNSDEDIAFQVKRYVASRSIALVLRGVPGIYFHGLLGTRNDVEAVLRTKTKRDINRRVIDEYELVEALDDSKSTFSYIVRQLGKLLDIRVRQSAFHPNGEQRVLTLSPDVFAVLRVCPDCTQHILTLTNITHRVRQIKIPLIELGVAGIYSVEDLPDVPQDAGAASSSSPIMCATPEETYWYDLVGKRGWRADDQGLEVTLQPYDVAWLIPFVELESMIES